MAAGPGLAMKMTADTAGISRGVNRTEKLLGQLARSTKSATSAMRGLVAIEVGKILAGGFASVANSIGGFIGNIRESVGELNKLAFISNTSVSNFQALATAASMVGVEQDKLSDIFKDVNDRVGDFLTTGGGPMADFFEQIGPKVGVTADMFRGLSGPDALQLFIDSLEKAGLSQAEMTFYLEAMSSDLTALLPLLQNGGAGFDKLAERAERLGIVLTENQTSAITEMNNALKLVYQTFEGIIGQVVANLAPAVTAIAEEFLQFVEGYNGLGEGGGGNALADSITLALFEGAEYIALAFDTALQYLGVFTDVMTQVGKGFMIAMDFFYKTYELLNAAFYSLRISLNEWIIAAVKGLTEIVSYIPGAGDLAQFGEFFAQDLQRSVESDRKAQETALENFASGLTFEDFGADSQGPAGRLVDDLRARFEASQAARGQGQGEARGGGGGFDSSALEEARRLAEEQARLEEQRLKKIADLNEQYADKSEEIERNRLDALGRVNQQALEATDIRSGGIGQVLALATGREDPAIAEARKQLDELQNISREIRKLGGTVELVGAA
jgi:hypothetical protein